MAHDHTSKKTALYDEHLALGGKVIEFGGWLMPVQYTSIMDEHNAIRNGVADHDPAAAQQAMRDHLDHVQATYGGQMPEMS